MAERVAVVVAMTDIGGAICPEAKAIVVGKTLLVPPQPANGITETAHRNQRSSPRIEFLAL
jgi:hypothetical protein